MQTHYSERELEARVQEYTERDTSSSTYCGGEPPCDERAEQRLENGVLVRDHIGAIAELFAFESQGVQHVHAKQLESGPPIRVGDVCHLIMGIT